MATKEMGASLYEFALNNVHEAAFLVNKNGFFEYVNDEACRYLGYSRYELLQMGVSDIDPEFPVERWLSHWQELKENQTLTFERPHKTKDGHIIPVEVNANYFQYGDHEYNLALVRDIHERKQAEQQRLTHLHFLACMDRVNTAIQVAGDLDTMMSSVLDEVLAIFDCDRAALIYPCDPDAEFWKVPMERFKPEYPGIFSLGIAMPMTPEVSVMHRVSRLSNCPIRFGANTDYPLAEEIKAYGDQSGVGMAIYPKTDNAWGFSISQCAYPRVWSDEEVKIFQEIGRRLGDALTNLLILQDLRESESKYRRIVDTAHEGIWVLGPDNLTVFVNARMAEMLGYEEHEMRHRPMNEFMFKEDAVQYLQQIKDNPKSVEENYECRFRCKDGKTAWAYASTTPILDDKQGFNGSFAMFTDITEHRATEQQLQLLRYSLDQVGETILLMGESDPHFIYANQSSVHNLGYSREALTGGMGVFDIDPDWDPQLWQQFWPQLQTQRQMQFESRHQTQDGRIFPVEVTANYFEYGGKAYNLTICRDISERKRIEQELDSYKNHLEETVQQRTSELLMARDVAEAANKAKSVFLANMSHELRTPLNAILGFSQLLSTDPDIPAVQRGDLNIINHSGEHLLKLINDVLEMSKIEAGRIQLTNKVFDLATMVRNITDMMIVKADEKGLELLLDQSSCFPRYIVGDEARMRQVLLNLIGNAIKFTDKGSVTVRLGTIGNKTSHLLIQVEDTGVGISVEHQQRIFEPFEQSTGHENNQGTGLGLSITKQFVQLMGGTVTLVSKPGEGSLFQINLPLGAEVTETDVANMNKTRYEGTVCLEQGHPDYRILIVEDQLENQLLLSKLMQVLGLEIKIAENGKQAIEMFASWQPHLIWMDRKMPIMDGLEALKQIRKLPNGQGVKIIAVTASAFKEQKLELLGAGMDDFVSKPYRPDEIYDCLKKHLDLRFVSDGY